MVSKSYVGQDLEALSELRNYQSWILRDFAPHLRGHIIEVGAGIGNIAARYHHQAESLVLLEPASNLHERLRARFREAPHVRVVGDTLGGAIDAGSVRPSSYDTAIMVNVLEHIADDKKLLQQLFSLLVPGGTLLLFVPALPFLYGSLDRTVHHERRYTRERLTSLLAETGFTVSDIRFFDSLGMLPWWLSGRVLKERTFNESRAQFYDRWCVPLISRLERVVPPPLGKNLWCVAHRS